MANKFNPKIADIARQKIGKFVKQRRNKLKITQPELAEAVDVRVATISDFEKGKANLGINTLIGILGVLRIEIQFIEKDPESMPGFDSPSKN